MGSIVGGITDAIGITDHESEEQAEDTAAQNAARANSLSDKQIELAEEQLQFQKDQYADWKNIYGDIQENLGDYYKNLSSDKIVSLGLESQQKEFQQVQKSISQTYAQRGLSNSGQELSSLATNETQNAVARATIRANADQMAAERKLQFLGVGLGQGTSMLNNIANSASNVTNAYSSAVDSSTKLSGNYLSTATSLSQSNSEATQDLWGTALAIAKRK